VLLMCPNVFLATVCCDCINGLLAVYTEETSERQVPLPDVAQAFHFSFRTWKHMARWWNGVERETWVKADLSILYFLTSLFQTSFSVKRQTTYMAFFSTEDLFLSFDNRLFNNSW